MVNGQVIGLPGTTHGRAEWFGKIFPVDSVGQGVRILDHVDGAVPLPDAMFCKRRKGDASICHEVMMEGGSPALDV